MNDADSRKIQEVLNWYRQTKGKSSQPRQVQYPRLVAGVIQKLIKAPSGGIPKRVGTLLGSAECDVWDANETTGQLEDTTVDITVKNWATSITCANGERYGWAEFYDGIWWIVSEDCSDTGNDTVSAAFSTAGSSFELPYSTGDTTSAPGIVVGREIEFTFTGTIA